jgi:hypothetical protein
MDPKLKKGEMLQVTVPLSLTACLIFSIFMNTKTVFNHHAPPISAEFSHHAPPRTTLRPSSLLLFSSVTGSF